MNAKLPKAASRMAALGLLGLLVAAVWSEAVAPIWAYNLSLTREIEEGRKRLARYERIAINKDRVDDLLKEISIEPDMKEFLAGDSEAMSVATLQDKLQEMVKKNRAKLKSASPLKTIMDGDLRLAGLRLHLTGRLKRIHGLTYEIESQIPRLFIEKASIRRIPGRVSSKDPGPTKLEVQMDTYGVLWPRGS